MVVAAVNLTRYTPFPPPLVLNNICCIQVFVTHSHVDHVKDISYMCKKEGVVVHCPANTEERLLNYVRAEVIIPASTTTRRLPTVLHISGRWTGIVK